MGSGGPVHQLAPPQRPSGGGLALQDSENAPQHRSGRAPAAGQAGGERPRDPLERGLEQVIAIRSRRCRAASRCWALTSTREASDDGGQIAAQPDSADYDTSTLRMCISGGAALPVEVLRGFEEAFGVPVLEGYGLSETSPVASFNHPGRERKPGSIGTPIRDVQMRVVDGRDHEVPQGEVGEIVIRGPNVMKGYWHRPEATAEAIRDRAGSTAVTWPGPTRTATSTSWTGKGPDHRAATTSTPGRSRKCSTSIPRSPRPP